MKYHILISESFRITYEVEADSIKEAEDKYYSRNEWRDSEIVRESGEWVHVSTEEVEDES